MPNAYRIRSADKNHKSRVQKHVKCIFFRLLLCSADQAQSDYLTEMQRLRMHTNTQTNNYVVDNPRYSQKQRKSTWPHKTLNTTTITTTTKREKKKRQHCKWTAAYTFRKLAVEKYHGRFKFRFYPERDNSRQQINNNKCKHVSVLLFFFFFCASATFSSRFCTMCSSIVHVQLAYALAHTCETQFPSSPIAISLPYKTVYHGLYKQNKE